MDGASVGFQCQTFIVRLNFSSVRPDRPGFETYWEVGISNSWFRWVRPQTPNLRKRLSHIGLVRVRVFICVPRYGTVRHFGRLRTGGAGPGWSENLKRAMIRPTSTSETRPIIKDPKLCVYSEGQIERTGSSLESWDRYPNWSKHPTIVSPNASIRPNRAEVW